MSQVTYVLHKHLKRALKSDQAAMRQPASQVMCQVLKKGTFAGAGGGALPDNKEGYMPVQPLHIRLNLASQEDHAALADAVTAPHAYARPLPELQ